MSLDVGTIKKDFPVLQRNINGKRLIYLDSANTSQKPASVMDAMEDYYRKFNANVHRGSYQLANEATAILEGARDKVQSFINANSRKEIVFTKNEQAVNSCLIELPFSHTNLLFSHKILTFELINHFLISFYI